MLLLVGLLSAQGLLYAPFGKEARELERRKIVLQYLSDKSILKKHILSQDKTSLTILDLFYMGVFGPWFRDNHHSMEKYYEIINNIKTLKATNEDLQWLFWYNACLNIQWHYDAERKDSEGKFIWYPVKLHNTVMQKCEQVMKDLGYTIDNSPNEFALVYSALLKTRDEQKTLQKQLKEFDKNNPEQNQTESEQTQK